MPQPKQHVLLADQLCPWRTELQEVLENDEIEVSITDEGEAVLRATGSKTPPRLVVIGGELRPPGALEIVYLLSLEKQRPIVVLLCDARSDLELLDLLRRRGVDTIISRDEGVATTAARIQARLFADSRAEERLPVEIEATLRLNANSVASHVADLTTKGAKVVIAARNSIDGIGVSATIQLELSSALTVDAIIRRVQLHKRLLGNEIHLGVQFVGITDEMNAAIAAIIESDQERYLRRQQVQTRVDMQMRLTGRRF